LTAATPSWLTTVPKPRDVRRTQILDKGLGRRQIEDMLEVAGDLIDLVKLGWGTALVTTGVADKIKHYQNGGIEVCLGGTLLEVYNRRGEIDQFRDYISGLGLTHVEVSDGTIDLPLDEKLSLISRFAGDYTVYSEVGQKDPEVVVTPAKWVTAIKAELEAGATKVILDAGIPPEKLIFETPNKASQTWFIRHIGVDVNLANIPPEDVISLETLRLGLRADTLIDIHGR